MNKEVVVYVEGGVIQDINIPEGVRVIVKDYDTDADDLNEDYIKIDKEGYYYRESIWD